MINTEISEAIESAMRETTFTEAALQTFKDSLDKVKKLESDLSESKSNENSARSSRDEERKDNNKLREELEVVTKELGDLKKREADIASKETRTAVAEGKYTAFAHAMELVFKVPETRKEIHKSVGQPQYSDSNGYVQYPPDSQSSETIIETEE